MNELLIKLQTHLDNLHISDIEPWSEYRIEGQWLFELERIVRGVDDD